MFTPKTLISLLRILPGLGLRECLLLVRYRIRLLYWQKVSFPKALIDVKADWLREARSPFARAEMKEAAVWSRDDQKLREFLNRFKSGQHLFFGWHWQHRDWRTDPLTGESLDQGFWPRCRGPNSGDTKWVWDQSRFDWVSSLMRMSAHPDGDTCAGVFWDTLRGWVACNPAQEGLAWQCAQECSIRMLNILWGLSCFSPQSTADEKMVWSLIAQFASRVEMATDYGRAQRNNHGLTEATALLAASLSLPFHPCSVRWRQIGLKYFVDQIQDQFAEDGSYILDSFSYHRQALRVATVWLLLCRAGEIEIPQLVTERVRCAARFLRDHMDANSGRLPNYGQTDGSNLFSFSSSAIDDFRPVVQTAYFASSSEWLLPAGTYNEEISWYFPNAREPESMPESSLQSSHIVDSRAGGYFSFFAPRSHAMIRCHTHRHRPGHADMLHLDLWYRDLNLLCDSGTYSYAATSAEGARLRSTCSHNTIQIDNLEQMTPFRRFLWLDWTSANLLSCKLHNDQNEKGFEWSGEHFGYHIHPAKVTHRREVCYSSEQWRVVDELKPAGNGSIAWSATLHWHLTHLLNWKEFDGGAAATLPDGNRVEVFVRVLSKEISEEPIIQMGQELRSPIYGQRLDGPVLRLQIRSEKTLRLETTIRFSPAAR